MVQLTLPKNSKISVGKTWNKPEGDGDWKEFKIYRWNPDDRLTPRLDTFYVDRSQCGQMVLDALEAEALAFKPRTISSDMMAKFQQLPTEITAKVLVETGVCKDNKAAGTYLARWQKGGLVKKNSRGSYEKC